MMNLQSHPTHSVVAPPGVLGVSRAIRNFQSAQPDLAEAVLKVVGKAKDRLVLFHLAAASAFRTCGLRAHWEAPRCRVRSRYVPDGVIVVPPITGVECIPMARKAFERSPFGKDAFIALVEAELLRAFRPVPPAALGAATDGIGAFAGAMWRYTLKAYVVFVEKMRAHCYAHTA